MEVQIERFKPTKEDEHKLAIIRGWERGLFDFSARNPLLCFKGKNAVKLLVSDLDDFLKRLARRGGLRLVSEEQGEERGDNEGSVYTPLAAKEADALAAKLRRRNREAAEETGANVLFLACGFLRYGEEGRLAPVVLVPVELTSARGREWYSLIPAGEPFVNATLLEYLAQTYGIMDRGLDDAALSVKEILSILKENTAQLQGWEVNEEAYLATFFFQRFLIWNDFKEHSSAYEKNQSVQALVRGKIDLPPPMSEVEPHLRVGMSADGAPMPEVEADFDKGAPMPETELSCEDLVLPLPSDASQRAAVHLSASGNSFVLHGPPGTGKSQTIANIIALSLERGKSVLFVAQKRAALEVVKRRLNEIGLGDFCFELPKGGSDEAFKQFRRTLQLTSDEAESSGGEYLTLRRSLQDTHDALYQKRSFSLSVHEAILAYLKRKGSPDVVSMDSDFYASLDEEKFARCKSLILSAASAAKECGGVANSPFENVNLTEYSLAVRDRATIAAKVLLGESAHLKCMLALILDFFKQRIANFTTAKAARLADLLRGLLSGKYDRYFKGVTTEEFLRFVSANHRLDFNYAFCEKHFKVLINLEEEWEEVQALLEEGDLPVGRNTEQLKKRLERAALHSLAQEDIPRYLKAVVEIFRARGELAACPLSQSFVERSGRINRRKRQEFLAPLKELSQIAASVFAEFAPNPFYEGCIQAANGCAEPLFQGYLAANRSFLDAKARSLESTGADEGRNIEEGMEYFSAKAAALLEHSDLLRAWCGYNAAEHQLERQGMKFVGAALKSGALSPDELLSGFEKSFYERFLFETIPLDENLSHMTSGSTESEAEQLALLGEREMMKKRGRIFKTLVDRLPKEEEDQAELSLLFKLERSNKRGRLRQLFLGAPKLMKRICPCLLASPDGVSQYLAPRTDEYDIVIFDEASQMTTPEAVPSLARAKQAVIVGDNCQLPPTPFFRTAFCREDEEDLESVLDTAIAAGFKEQYLSWHYRSRHESLVAFSNAAYYENRLSTFPSPISSKSRVSLCKVEGVYERGGRKRNKQEAEALVQEVIRRLSDPELCKQSIGVVTFSGVQREEIERILTKEISRRSLEEVAYGGREPLFIKNLENVQGAERDVILFSVCYGFNGEGKLYYNFGALNRAGGWRRLNVACSRAREEMIVFSSLTAADIDLSRTSSKGMAGLKAFLEFAQKGKISSVHAQNQGKREGIGVYIAEELNRLGYDAIAGMGMGNFKLDVAVSDPDDKNRYLLGILVGDESLSAVDRFALLPKALHRMGWNLLSVSEVAYFHNPKREIKRIKDTLDKLTGKKREEKILRYARPYRYAKNQGGKTESFVTDGGHEEEITARLSEIVQREQPISRSFLKKRCMESMGISSWGALADEKLELMIARAAFPFERVGGREYYYQTRSALALNKFRKEGKIKRRSGAEDFTPFETAALIKGLLEEHVTLYDDELVSVVSNAYGIKPSPHFAEFLSSVVSYGEERGLFRRAVSGRISLVNDCKAK